jgi:glycosyltransferase involved in cell wall biosynthesis
MESEEQPLVSVIIPTFNRAELVRRAVLSVLDQSYENLEVVVVDDASTDSTGEMIQKIDDSRVKYLRLEINCGPAGARNAGVNLACGEFVTFLDSDDSWSAQKTAVQLAALQQQNNPGNVVSYTQATIVGSGVRRYLLPLRGKGEDEPVADYVCGNEGLIQTSSLMLSRKLALANPFPRDQKNFEDWDLFLRLEAKGVSWLYLDQPLVTWNNDDRSDRLTLSPQDGSAWLDAHKCYMSKNARNAFALKAIVLPLIRQRKRKLYTFKVLMQVLLGSEVSFIRFMKLSIKIFIPVSR